MALAEEKEVIAMNNEQNVKGCQDLCNTWEGEWMRLIILDFSFAMLVKQNGPCKTRIDEKAAQ